MRGLVNFFHHLFNPHCPDCKLDEEAKKVCPNCDVLRTLLEQERFRNNQLIQHVLIKDAPPKVEELKEVPFVPRHLPWQAQREKLERAAREESEKNKEKIVRERNEQLEKDLRIENASS